MIDSLTGNHFPGLELESEIHGETLRPERPAGPLAATLSPGARLRRVRLHAEGVGRLSVQMLENRVECNQPARTKTTHVSFFSRAHDVAFRIVSVPSFPKDAGVHDRATDS
jgi:hypothetical protein